MNDYVLLIYPALLLLVTFMGARLSGRGRVPDSFLSLEQSKLVQASACIGVILHHVTQQVTSYGSFEKGPITLFNYIGFLFTALFFFSSGFGLLTSLQEKPGYLDSFLIRRLPAVLVPFWCINALGVLLRASIYRIPLRTGDILRGIFGIDLVNSNGWFIVEITIFYLIFYILFRLIKNRDIALVLLCAAVIGIIVLSTRLGHDPQGKQAHWFRGEWWYNSTVTFLFGLLLARFRKPMTAFFNRFWKFLLPLGTVLFAAALHLSIIYVDRGGYYLGSMTLPRSDIPAPLFQPFTTLASRTLIAQSAACILFTLIVLLLEMRITLGSRALRFLGTVSRDLFLIHGYFIGMIFAPVRMNDFLRYAAVLSCSIASTALISPLIRRIVKGVIRLLEGAAASMRAAARAAAEEGRKKDRRKLFALCAAALLIFLASVPLYRDRTARKEYAEEMGALRDAAVFDEVLWGRYETDTSAIGRERLEWIVIGREGEKVCLLTKYGIAGGYYHQKHTEVSWEDSDLRARLNSREFTGMFSRYEMRHILEADGDIVSLLPADRAAEVFATDEERIMSITAAAEKQGVNADRVSHDKVWFDRLYCSSWWWLRGEPGQEAVTAPIVEMDGSIRMAERAVNKPRGAVRPMVWVDTGQVQR